jgi:hypothetical protein
MTQEFLAEADGALSESISIICQKSRYANSASMSAIPRPLPSEFGFDERHPASLANLGGNVAVSRKHAGLCARAVDPTVGKPWSLAQRDALYVVAHFEVRTIALCRSARRTSNDLEPTARGRECA